MGGGGRPRLAVPSTPMSLRGAGLPLRGGPTVPVLGVKRQHAVGRGLLKNDVNEPAPREVAIAPWLWLEVGMVPAACPQDGGAQVWSGWASEPQAAAVWRWERVERSTGVPECAYSAAFLRLLVIAGAPREIDVRGVVNSNLKVNNINRESP